MNKKHTCLELNCKNCNIEKSFDVSTKITVIYCDYTKQYTTDDFFDTRIRTQNISICRNKCIFFKRGCILFKIFNC